VKTSIAILAGMTLAIGCTSEPNATDDVTDAVTISSRAGVDYAWSKPSAAGLRAAGYTFVSRYLSYDTSGKDITIGEANALHAAGIDIVLNWEASATGALGGYTVGVAHATRARDLAAALGAPPWLPIYFSIDFNPVGAQFAALDAYFDGVVSVLGHDRVGAYGGIGTISHLFDTNRIRWGWQTYAWSAHQWDPRAQVRQVFNGGAVEGVAVDIDTSLVEDFGQWSASPGVAAAVNPITGIRDLYAIRASGELVHTWADATGPWRGWDSLGCCFKGTPAATAHPGNGIRDVYAVRVDDTLVHNWAWGTGPWMGFDELLANVQGSPAAIVTPSTGNREVFAITSTGELVHDWSMATSGWIGWDHIGDGFAGSPAATVNPTNGIRDVYAMYSDGTLLHDWAWETGPWIGLDIVGGGFVGRPAATTNPTNGIRDVYVVDRDANLVHTWAWNTGPWLGFDPIASGIIASPAATTDPINGIRDVYAVDEAGTLVHDWAWNTGPWIGIDPVGTMTSTTPTATTHPASGMREVYGTAGDGVVHNWAETTGPWMGWDTP
jgi:hypothetical protein